MLSEVSYLVGGLDGGQGHKSLKLLGAFYPLAQVCPGLSERLTAWCRATPACLLLPHSSHHLIDYCSCRAWLSACMQIAGVQPSRLQPTVRPYSLLPGPQQMPYGLV